VLDCSVGTVKSRILRGRRALKGILEPLLGEKEVPARRESVRRPAPAPSYGLQMGLQMAYVQATPAMSESEVVSRHAMTREEKS